MICKNCGATIDKDYDMQGENLLVCPACGKKYMLKQKETAAPQYTASYQPTYAAPTPVNINVSNQPAAYGTDPRFMGAWSYFWLEILYFIPIIGTIFLIIHACKKSHENRCHFARSRFCGLLIVGIALLIVVIVLLATGVSFNEIFGNARSYRW